jgi:hypothetical protein
MNIVAYTRESGRVSVIYPTIEYLDKIVMIADKDTPSGLYYKILNIKDLPPRETRSSWELNLDSNNSDGIGLTKEEFDVKYPEHKGMAVQ